MKKLVKCLFAALFVVGLAFSGVGCAENKQCPKECSKECRKKCPPGAHKDKEGARPCPKAAAAKQETPPAQPAPAPAPAKPAPQGEKK
jgi:hypothetical protein